MLSTSMEQAKASGLRLRHTYEESLTDLIKPSSFSTETRAVGIPSMVSLMASAHSAPAKSDSPSATKPTLTSAQCGPHLNTSNIASIHNAALDILNAKDDNSMDCSSAANGIQKKRHENQVMSGNDGIKSSIANHLATMGSVTIQQHYNSLLPSTASTASKSSTAITRHAATTTTPPTSSPNTPRLNKFVRRLYDMLKAESATGIVEWRRGLLVLHSTAEFTKKILPKYFHTKNFKTFRRQLNYYGFVHVRSFSSTCVATDDPEAGVELAAASESAEADVAPSTRAGNTTTALWVNRNLAAQTQDGIPNKSIESVLLLRRVEPCEEAKTVEGRRFRKEQAIHTVEEDLGVSAKTLQMDQIKALTIRCSNMPAANTNSSIPLPSTTPSSRVSAMKVQEDERQTASNTCNKTLASSEDGSSCSSFKAGPPKFPDLRDSSRLWGRTVSCGETASTVIANKVKPSQAYRASNTSSLGFSNSHMNVPQINRTVQEAAAAHLLLFLASSKR